MESFFYIAVPVMGGLLGIWLDLIRGIKAPYLFWFIGFCTGFITFMVSR